MGGTHCYRCLWRWWGPERKGVEMLGWCIIPYFTYTSPSRDKCSLSSSSWSPNIVFFGSGPVGFVCTTISSILGLGGLFWGVFYLFLFYFTFFYK